MKKVKVASGFGGRSKQGLSVKVGWSVEARAIVYADESVYLNADDLIDAMATLKDGLAGEQVLDWPDAVRYHINNLKEHAREQTYEQMHGSFEEKVR